MKIFPSICPECGQQVAYTCDMVPANAELGIGADGSFEYSGESNMCWDGQYIVEENGLPMVLCGNAHIWPAIIAGEGFSVSLIDANYEYTYQVHVVDIRFDDNSTDPLVLTKGLVGDEIIERSYRASELIALVAAADEFYEPLDESDLDATWGTVEAADARQQAHWDRLAADIIDEAKALRQQR